MGLIKSKQLIEMFISGYLHVNRGGAMLIGGDY